jgi:hypothetical protein
MEENNRLKLIDMKKLKDMTLDELIKRAEIISKIIIALCAVLLVLVFIYTFL